MTSVPHAKVIVNPTAGANKTYKKWPLLNRLLDHIGLSFDHQYTEGTGHAIEIAHEATSDGYRYLVAVGGDGTVNEVANGILNAGNSGDVSFGVVSTGTGSDFARSAGVPLDYVNACTMLTSTKRFVIDAGIVEYHKNGEKMQRYYVNAAGIGFDAAAVESTEKIPKYFGGTIPYLTGLLRTLIGYRNKSVVMDIDDKKRSAKILSVIVANGNYLGGGMHVAPDAVMDDALLDVVVIGDIGKLDLLKSLPMIYKGTHGEHPKVGIERAAEVSIDTSERVLVHADGELLGEGPASFKLLPSALSLVV
ncbi:MAG: diacylglycerol kinase family lipid kinase [Dehalococcoidales bacterium]|nr:MAG: diacylglycerol kinase family lipid kinase [Dehalococcoidales bacterium]